MRFAQGSLQPAASLSGIRKVRTTLSHHWIDMFWQWLTLIVMISSPEVKTQAPGESGRRSKPQLLLNTASVMQAMPSGSHLVPAQIFPDY
ncbi:hypothetical protein B2K_30520 [Paenibacillus mucilaginosus K02]|uniref:Uncharacterized protein n=1 Tax=Paenibacillus mucilaginosus K02 TaxID=997761 RepID=I0BRJ1_9BACL|nr:hypothetical protein B2K_30520 [Paenibacillus mucilaginosus K02]